MTRVSSYISSILPNRAEDSYAAISSDEPGVDPPAQLDNEKALRPTASNTTTSEHQKLLKQCFIYIILSILFMIASTTIIVSKGTSKCRTAPTTTPTTTVLPQTTAHIPNPTAQNRTIDCGKNAQTARERHCHFDLISFTWLRHECYDHELTEQFSREKNWQWSLDANGTQLVSQQQIRNGEVDVGWVTWEYHLTHCLYTWMKLNRAVARRAPIDGYIANTNHTNHCSKLLLARGDEMQARNSEFFVQYPACYL
ncbi:MAG: hypothetical protein M1840_008526 [Geoglossum simile]|nr:MAG: hypothetical protein M1840_008526 [Geoglossum simile]